MPVLKTSRFEINYVEAGEGFPVILIHGLAGDHSAWRPQIEALKTTIELLHLIIRVQAIAPW